jgi:hypothetical protein
LALGHRQGEPGPIVGPHLAVGAFEELGQIAHRALASRSGIRHGQGSTTSISRRSRGLAAPKGIEHMGGFVREPPPRGSGGIEPVLPSELLEDLGGREQADDRQVAGGAL